MYTRFSTKFIESIRLYRFLVEEGDEYLTSYLVGIWLGTTMIVGALLHVRIKDPFKEITPALVIMVLALIVSILNL